MINIFVEGKGDHVFLEVYLNHILKGKSKEYTIIPTGGYTNIKNSENEFQKNTDLGGTNLIIFDADSAINSGGYAPRKKYIKDELTKISAAANIFLFPNDTDDGEYENLLEKIINPSHQCLLDCFEKYQNCVVYKDDERKIYKTPIQKAKMYSYIDSIKKPKDQEKKFKNKKEYFFDNPEYWDLESAYLTPLKVFLEKYLT